MTLRCGIFRIYCPACVYVPCHRPSCDMNNNQTAYLGTVASGGISCTPLSHACPAAESGRAHGLFWHPSSPFRYGRIRNVCPASPCAHRLFCGTRCNPAPALLVKLARMTGDAFNLPVLALQCIFRIAVVVKADCFPVLFLVA